MEGVDADYYGISGLQKAVRSLPENSDKKYEIHLIGSFIARPEDFIPYDFDNQSILIPTREYLTITGDGVDKSKIICELPDNLDVNYRSLNMMVCKKSLTIKNISLVAKNIRYPLHIYGGTARDQTFLIENCEIIHHGNTGKALKEWPYPRPFGVGMSSGMKFFVKHSFLYSEMCPPIYHGSNCHFNKPAYFEYENTRFETGKDGAVLLYAQGSNTINTVSLKNIDLSGTIEVVEGFWTIRKMNEQFADHNEFDLQMSETPPQPYKYNSRGRALKIISNSQTEKSTVRVDTTCAAFPLIIGLKNSVTRKCSSPNWKWDNGYFYRDGGGGLNGFACGIVSVQEELRKVNKFSDDISLGSRLGDCSQKNKTLNIIVDDKPISIIFDKDYTTENNKQILAEMNEQLKSFALVTLCDPGIEYYPSFEGVIKATYTGTAFVQSGMGVILTSGNFFRKALSSDNHIDGICLDDGKFNDICRIMTKGKIWGKITNNRFCTNEIENSNHKIGATLGISKTNPGVFSDNTKPAVLKATNNNILEIILKNER